MPEREITVTVTYEGELSPMQADMMGRDAAQGILSEHGTLSYARNPAAASVTGVRYRDTTYATRRYVGPSESEEWAVTEGERRTWGLERAP